MHACNAQLLHINGCHENVSHLLLARGLPEISVDQARPAEEALHRS